MKKKCLKIILAFMLVMVITFQYPVEAKAFSFGDFFNSVGKIFNNGVKFLGNVSNSTKNFSKMLENAGNLAKKYDQSGLGNSLTKLAHNNSRRFIKEHSDMSQHTKTSRSFICIYI